jgi:hypothetical protein
MRIFIPKHFFPQFFEKEYPNIKDVKSKIDSIQNETDLYKTYSKYDGYEFFGMQKNNECNSHLIKG